MGHICFLIEIISVVRPFWWYNVRLQCPLQSADPATRKTVQTIHHYVTEKLLNSKTTPWLYHVFQAKAGILLIVNCIDEKINLLCQQIH